MVPQWFFQWFPLWSPLCFSYVPPFGFPMVPPLVFFQFSADSFRISLYSHVLSIQIVLRCSIVFLNGPPLTLCGFPMVFLWFPLWFSFPYSQIPLGFPSNPTRLPLTFLWFSTGAPLVFPMVSPLVPLCVSSGSPFGFHMGPPLVFLWFPLWFRSSFLQIPVGFLCNPMCSPLNCPLVFHSFPNGPPLIFDGFPTVFLWLPLWFSFNIVQIP